MRQAHLRQKQRQGDHDAAHHHKGNHVGDAVHQVAVRFAAQLPPIAGAEGVAAAVDGHLAVQRLVQHGVSIAHRVTGRDCHQTLAHEPRHRHALVGGNDDAVCGGDLVAFQLVVHAHRTVGLHFDGHAPLLRRFAQGLGRQVSVGHAHGAGRNRQQPVLGRGRRRLGGRALLCRRRSRFRVPGDQAAKSRWRGGIQHLPADFLIQQQGGQARQHLHMQVVGICRCSDQKQQPHRLAVRRIAGQRRVQR